MPSAEIPAFLMDFMNHRKHLSKQDMTNPAVKKSAALQPAKDKKELEMAIEGIIEKKPKNKVVKEFFQNRVDELSKNKMDK
jgi:hypothetical protein